MTVTISLEHLPVLALMLIVYLLSCIIDRCEQKRGITNWLIRTLEE